VRLIVRVPMASSCAHVLGALGPYRAMLPPSVDLKLPDSPSFACLRSHATEFARFRGGRDLFAALTTVTAVGREGQELAEMTNARLAIDEELRGEVLDRLDGEWFALWMEALAVYRTVWPEARRPLERAASRLRARVRRQGDRLEDLLRATIRPKDAELPEVVVVALVERAIGMHRAAEGVVVLETLPYLWPHCLAHELVHAVTPHYRPDSAVHELAGELLADLAAETLGRGLARPGHWGFSPEDEMAERWEGWKLSYGSDVAVTAETARGKALGVWREYIASGSSFEDAIDRLAEAMEGGGVGGSPARWPVTS